MRSTWRLLAAAAAVAFAAPWGRVWAADGDAAGSASGLADGVFRYGFSECVDNERTLFYYTDKEETCSNGSVVSKPPVHGLRCDIVCDKGYFLGANFSGEVPVSGCEKCPRGKYSLGGGKLFSKRSKAWTNPLPIDIHSECVTRNLYTNEWQNNCNTWRATADGAMVESGDNRNILEQFEAGRLFSSLRISVTFVRNGTVTFQYKVSAEAPYDGLVFGIDDQTVMELVSKTEGWQEAVFKVGPGAHTFAWDYTKDFSGDDGDDKAYIKVIELVGTAYSDTYCHACGSDTTMSGGSLCAFCKQNEYAAPKSDSELDFTCYSCPKNTFSPKGSIGLESCVARRPCSSDDVTETFTRCINGKRNVTFSWSEPQTCELDLPGAASLPAAKIDVACEACERGYRLNEDNLCEKCPAGERIEGDGTCRKCPAGEVAVNQLAFGRGTTTGWSEWPSIVDVSGAKQAGWKLTRDGLLFSPDLIHPGALAESSRFPLPFNVTFAHSGELEVMYALQNVPTFENDGARAWLEIEVEDASASAKDKTVEDEEDDTKNDAVDTKDGTQVDVDGDGVAEQVIHLSNGGNNGTSSEGFHFNVTKPSSKQFRLVLRTTNPKATRMIQAKILLLRFYGTEEGAGVTCGTCAPGFQAIHSSEFNGCKICAAGTYATEASGIIVCQKCPKNTWSREGATKCEVCGTNTLSAEGAKSCSPPTVLTVNASTANTSSPSNIRYNIELLQSLVWGNLSTFGWDDAFEDELDQLFDEAGEGGPSWTTGMVESGPVSPAHAFQVDQTTSLLSGLFRPVSNKWKEAVQGHIVEELVDTDKDRPYIVLLSVLNAKDAGGNFKQKSGRYGEVQCSVPAQWRVSSGGSEMAIEPSVNGSGVTVHYTGGSPCKNGRLATTTLRYLCDLKAGTPDRPTKMKHDADKCHFDLEWKSSFACPICDSSFFSEAKTSCSDGQQSVTYARNQACYGGYQPESVPVSTCSDIVLDTQAIYTAYAAISVVAFVILLLLAGIMVIHRKYRAAYNDYLYLKGKMPVNEVISKDGTKESTFEFTPTSTAIHSSSPHSGGGGMFSPVEEEEKKEDEDNVRINSV